MNANLKLLKKKRVAHTGSKLPSISCDEPKLPPDDFVYNIMKDMDKKKNLISYQQFQEIKSQKRQEASINDDNFSYHNKQTKKMLPKKIFPLMKKCQTNLKHLKKNRCIPKPRAHVGPVKKPQFKPILNVEKTIAKFQHGISNNINKQKQSNSTFKKAISHSDFEVCKTSKFKSCVNKETVNRVQKKDEVQEQLSSSDDDAFEHFVQKANEKENDSSDSDTDSRLVIHRKRCKTKSKQVKKKTKDLYFDVEVNRKAPKVTSRPLPDSSESDGQETFESTKNKRNSFERCKYSEHELPMRLQENETFNMSLSEDDSQDLGDINRDSSDSESNLEVPTSNLLSIDQSNIFNHTALTSSKSKVPHGANNVYKSNINFDDNSCYSAPTKSMPMCVIPCYVRLIRDPEIDKKARNFGLFPTLPTSNIFYSSDDDCIIINENSDSKEIPEVPKSQACSFTAREIPHQDLDPQAIESNTIRDCSSSKTQANAIGEIHNLNRINNLSNSNNYITIGVETSVKNPQNSKAETDVDECVIVCEKPKSDNPMEVSDSFNLEKNTDPDLSQVKNKSSSTESNAANLINSGLQDFNVKIVAVHSLTELVESRTPESDVEVIDLSDDDSPVPDIRENNSATKEKIIDVPDSLHKLNQNESVVKDNESNLSLKCEPNTKILEILNKIDFESIKKAISTIKVEKPTNEFCKAGESSTSSNLLPLCTSIPMSTYEEDGNSREINSTNGKGFQMQNPKFSNKNDQLHCSLEPTRETSDSQVRNLNEFSRKLPDSQLVGSVKNIALKCTIDNNVKDFHTSNQSLRGNTDKGWCETETSLANNEITNTLLKVNSINPSSLENRTVTNASDMLPIHSKQNPETMSNQFCENIQNSTVADIMGLKVTELHTKEENKNYPDSSSATSNVTISNKQCKIYKIENEESLQNLHAIQPVKKEIVFESPSDELDAIAVSNIKDLKSNKNAISLFTVYKREYEKYKEIKNTETNVAAGLKMLHDNQLEKLKHLHASITNLAKHDACFYKINQDSCDDIKISIKNEITDKEDLIKKENYENPKEHRREEPLLPEKDVKVETKFQSSGPSREKVYGIMMSIKCAQCGKPATARCQGCANIFYCSSHCGEQSWRQGHYAVCKKS